MDESSKSVSFQPVGYSGLPGWPDDDHLAALRAFQASAPSVLKRLQSEFHSTGRYARRIEAFTAACRFVLDNRAELDSKAAARSFFESHFTPFTVVHRDPAGLLTGYYEPELQGALEPSSRFKVPVLARPPDLVNLVDEADRGAMAGSLTHARRMGPGQLVPHFTRREIDGGALAGQGLEILYLAHPVDLYFLQVQGSGLIRLDDGRKVRLGYAGKNGFRYTSIGQQLLETGEFTPNQMSLKSLQEWLKADAMRAKSLMWLNESYVFFRILGDHRETATMGTDGIPLTPLRSLAIDTGFFDLGLPIYVSCPSADHISNNPWGFRRLLIAHDVGSAIKGPERGDLFCGTGHEAGEIAGITKHAVNFFALFPKEEVARRTPAQ
ncbi:MAG: murein transglycosylase A [Alphaproteobacteria bacterium]|nr:murein transglycosylase A [Alphaproteobacteria bacterium]